VTRSFEARPSALSATLPFGKVRELVAGTPRRFTPRNALAVSPIDGRKRKAPALRPGPSYRFTRANGGPQGGNEP